MLWHYDFCQYDVEGEKGSEKISMQEFCKSNIIGLKVSTLHTYLQRVSGISKDQSISFEEYVAWQYFLKNIEAVLQHVKEFRFIDNAKFMGLVKQHEKRFEALSKKQLPACIRQDMVDGMFQMLDIDGNGQLDHDEIIGVLHKRINLGQGKEDQLKESI